MIVNPQSSMEWATGCPIVLTTISIDAFDHLERQEYCLEEVLRQARDRFTNWPDLLLNGKSKGFTFVTAPQSLEMLKQKVNLKIMTALKACLDDLDSMPKTRAKAAALDADSRLCEFEDDSPSPGQLRHLEGDERQWRN